MRVLLVLMLLVIFAANAYALDSSIDIELLPSGLAKEGIDVTFIAIEDADEIVYSLLNKPENLKVIEGNNELSYNLIENEFYEIVINKQVRRGQTYRLMLKFDIKGLVEQLDDKYIFSFRYELPARLDNFNLNLKLPKGFVLADIESAVSPSASKINTDGKIIMLSWSLRNVDNEQSFIVVYERGIVSNKAGVWVAVIVFMAAAIIIGVVLFYRKEKREIISNVLSQDENKIVGMIEAVDEITQKQIVKDTGFSKAKVSKIIRRLEEMGIVEKIPHMATNKLRIKNKIKR